MIMSIERLAIPISPPAVRQLTRQLLTQVIIGLVACIVGIGSHDTGSCRQLMGGRQGPWNWRRRLRYRTAWTRALGSRPMGEIIHLINTHYVKHIPPVRGMRGRSPLHLVRTKKSSDEEREGPAQNGLQPAARSHLGMGPGAGALTWHTML
ncbi:hypothetical protein F4778DRAFT_757656 [Xylariomycetidae sp. FL2044]|nr:hypothetical protein F4778DRAFT_757656 [Xylariomycetidae sp. FL2044]